MSATAVGIHTFDRRTILFGFLSFALCASGGVWILAGTQEGPGSSFWSGLGTYLFALGLFSAAIQSLAAPRNGTPASRALTTTSVVMGIAFCFLAAWISVQEVRFDSDLPSMFATRYAGTALLAGPLLLAASLAPAWARRAWAASQSSERWAPWPAS